MVFRILTLVLIFSLSKSVSVSAKVQYFESVGDIDCARLLKDHEPFRKLPILAIEPDFFDSSQVAAVQSLFEHFDRGKLRGEYSDENGIQLQDISPFLVSFFIHDKRIIEFKILGPRNLPQGVESLLLSVFQKLISQILMKAPRWNSFFEGRTRQGHVSLIRYILRSGIQYPKLAWHHDDYTIQSIIPISLPAGLYGARLQLQRRPTSHRSSIVADIMPEANQAVIFEGKKVWHQVSAFQIDPEESHLKRVEYRDILTLGIFNRTGRERTSAWK